MKQALRALGLGASATVPQEASSRSHSHSAEGPFQTRTESADSLKPENPIEELSPPRQQSPRCVLPLPLTGMQQ